MMERLDVAMRRVAAEAALMEPPPAVERAVLEEFDRAHHSRKRLYWTWEAGVAAALFVAVWLWQKPPSPVPATVVVPDQPFVAIPYVTPLAPNERADVVRVQMSVAALIAAGLPVAAADAGATAEADVVVGQDGRARAVRLVSISNFN